MTTLRVIFVHGISDMLPEKADYTFGFPGRLKAKLTKLGVIPANASEEEINQIITFEPAYYADIGHTEEENLWQAYLAERKRQYTFLDKMIDAMGSDRGRRLFVTIISDALIYLSEYCQHEIRQRLLDKLQPYVGGSDPVSIVAHSLGSVIAFDVLYYHNWHDWKPLNWKVTNLFSIGSPIALFSLAANSQGAEKIRNDPAIAMPDPNLVREDGTWLNFFDAQDLFGYPLEIYFEKKYKVKDVLVQNSYFPIEAHNGYWKNDKVLTQIAERLKLDLERSQQR